MIGDLESCNVMGDGLCTAHNQDGRLCRKQAVDEWDNLRLKHENLIAHFRDGFAKHGFILHPGLTPEQNAAEWAQRINTLKEQADAKNDLRAELHKQDRLKDEAVGEVAELQSALEDCLALLKAVEEQSGPERMKQFRVDPYGTIADAGTRLLLSRRITEGHKPLKRVDLQQKKPHCTICGGEFVSNGIDSVGPVQVCGNGHHTR